MPLIDASGMPMRMPLQQQMDGLREEMYAGFGIIQQLRMEILNQALKTQFIIKMMTEQNMMPDNINEQFNEFVKTELAHMNNNADEESSSSEIDGSTPLPSNQIRQLNL